MELSEGERGFTVEMSPEEYRSLVPDFSDRTQDTYANERTRKEVKRRVSAGEPVGPPQLKVVWDDAAKVWRVASQEGRSRTGTLQELGVGRMPVDILTSRIDDQHRQEGVFDPDAPTTRYRISQITPEQRRAPVVPLSSSTYLLDPEGEGRVTLRPIATEEGFAGQAVDTPTAPTPAPTPAAEPTTPAAEVVPETPPVQTDQSQRLVGSYNRALQEVSLTARGEKFKKATKKAKTLTMGVANSMERNRSPSRNLTPIYKTSESGSYELIEKAGDDGIWYAVPIAHEEFTHFKMVGGAFSESFDSKNYVAGAEQRVTLDRPAEFQKTGPDSWQLHQKGSLTFSQAPGAAPAAAPPVQKETKDVVTGDESRGSEVDETGIPPKDRVSESHGRSRETDAQFKTRRTEHVDALSRHVVAHAQAVDPGVNPEEVIREFKDRFELLEDTLDQDSAEAGRRDLLTAIAEYGGLGVVKGDSFYGELRDIRDSPANKPGGRFGGVSRVFRTRESGLTGTTQGHDLDRMVEMLRQDGRFSHIEGPNDLAEILDDISRAEEVVEGRIPGSDDLTDVGIYTNQVWWKDEASADPEGVVDITDLGDKQPRLPGETGAVRDEEVTPPPLADVPFSLEAPIGEIAEVETELFDKPGESVKKSLDTVAEAAKRRALDRLSRTQSGVPVDALPDVITYAAAKIAGGTLKGVALGRHLVKTFGTWVQEHLDDILAKATAAAPTIIEDTLEAAPRFYSKMAAVVDAKFPARGHKDMLQNILKKGGISREEVDWSGIEAWLEGRKGRIEKQEVMDFLAANGLEVEETILDDKKSEVEFDVQSPKETDHEPDEDQSITIVGKWEGIDWNRKGRIEKSEEGRASRIDQARR
jgi:hypothetical protein